MSKWKKTLPILALTTLSYWVIKQRKQSYKPLNLIKIEELLDYWKTKHLFEEIKEEDINIGLLYHQHLHYKYEESTLDYYIEAKDYLKTIEINKYSQEAKKATLQDYTFIYENDGSIANLSIVQNHHILNLTTFNQELFNECLKDLTSFYNPKWK